MINSTHSSTLSQPADGNNADGRAFLCFPDAVKEGVPPPVCTKVRLSRAILSSLDLSDEPNVLPQPGDSPDLAIKEKVFGVDLPKLLGENPVQSTGPKVEYNKPGPAPSGFTTTTASNGDNVSGSYQPEGGSIGSYTPPVYSPAGTPKQTPKQTPKPKKPKKPKRPKPHRPKKTPERVKFEPTFAAQQSGNGKGHDLTITTPVTITVRYTQH